MGHDGYEETMAVDRDAAVRDASARLRVHAVTERELYLTDAGEPLAILRRDGFGDRARWSLHFRFASTGPLRANMPIELSPTADRALGWASEELAALIADHWVLGEERPLTLALWSEGQAPRDPATAAGV